MSKELSRHEIREKALQALFPLDFNQELTKKDAINHALSIDQQEIVSEDEDAFVPVYLDELVGGVVEHQSNLASEQFPGVLYANLLRKLHRAGFHVTELFAE